MLVPLAGAEEREAAHGPSASSPSATRTGSSADRRADFTRTRAAPASELPPRDGAAAREQDLAVEPRGAPPASCARSSAEHAPRARRRVAGLGRGGPRPSRRSGRGGRRGAATRASRTRAGSARPPLRRASSAQAGRSATRPARSPSPRASVRRRGDRARPPRGRRRARRAAARPPGRAIPSATPARRPRSERRGAPPPPAAPRDPVLAASASWSGSTGAAQGAAPARSEPDEVVSRRARLKGHARRLPPTRAATAAASSRPPRASPSSTRRSGAAGRASAASRSGASGGVQGGSIAPRRDEALEPGREHRPSCATAPEPLERDLRRPAPWPARLITQGCAPATACTSSAMKPERQERRRSPRRRARPRRCDGRAAEPARRRRRGGRGSRSGPSTSSRRLMRCPRVSTSTTMGRRGCSRTIAQHLAGERERGLHPHLQPAGRPEDRHLARAGLRPSRAGRPPRRGRRARPGRASSEELRGGHRLPPRAPAAAAAGIRPRRGAAGRPAIGAPAARQSLGRVRAARRARASRPRERVLLRALRGPRARAAAARSSSSRAAARNAADVVVDEQVRLAEEVAVLAAVGAPDEARSDGVQLLDALRRLDDVRPGEAEPPLLAHHDRVAAARHDAHPAEAAPPAAHQRDDRHARRARTRGRARITSETATSPAFASCSRTPPESSRRRTPAGRSRAARRRSPTSFAPCTSPTAPPMNPPSWLAASTGRPPSRPAPTTTPSSKATGSPSAARCGLVTRSAGPRSSLKLPGSRTPARRRRAVASR